jgi:hypothetical protein
VTQLPKADLANTMLIEYCLDRILCMTVTLELRPDIEALVAERATAHGLTVEAYIQSVLENLVAKPAADSQQRSHLVEEWLKTPFVTNHGSALTPRIIGEGSPPKDRSREQAWFAAHRNQYAGQWVAIDGDRLLGNGTNLKQVVDAAHDAGVKDAMIARVEPCGALPCVGI